MTMEQIAWDLVAELSEHTKVSREMVEANQAHYAMRKVEYEGWAMSRLNHLLDFHRRACGYYNDFLDGKFGGCEEWGEVVDATGDRLVQMMRDVGLPGAPPLRARDLADHYERRLMEMSHGK